MHPMGQRVPPREQHQLIGWLADYFEAPAAVFRRMSADKRWTIYQRICDKRLYPSGDGDARKAVYH
jgi:hypothetical protein